MNVGGYTSGCDRDRDPRIRPESAHFGTTVSGVERPDFSAVATSSDQEGIVEGLECVNAVEVAVEVGVKSGGV